MSCKKPYKGLADKKDRNDLIAYVCCSVYDIRIGN
jgi:cytochrome c2